MEPVKVKLSKPVKNFAELVSEVTIAREVVGADLVACDGLGKNASTLKLIERLCGLSEAATMQLIVRDIEAIEKAMAPFAGYGPRDSTLSTDS